MSIRVRLALFGLLVVTLTLFAFTLAFYGLFAAGSGNGQDQQLAQRADQAVAALAVAPAEEFTPRVVPAPVDPAESLDVFVILLGPDGVPLTSTGEIGGAAPSIPPGVLATADEKGKAVASIEPSPGVRIRVDVRPWSRTDLGLNGHVAVAQSSRRVENDLRVGRIFLIAAAVFAFIVAGIAIWLVIGRALRPLKQLAALTNEVGLTQDLGRRLPVPGANDDLRRLSESFNGMMSRLEAAHSRLSDALDSQKRFVADASHELRTPLTTIRSNAGFLLQHPDAKDEDRLAALHDIAGESERMSRLVHDLLTLARADSGFHLEKAPVELAALLQDVTRQAGNLHPSLQFRADGAPASVEGNEDALKQLLWILIDNAARHTGEGGRIRLAAELREDGVSLIVADDGEGIPDADLPHVFDRFYQADVARSKGGSGLGLSIARWIVDEHGGRISAHNNDHGGATVVVELPASPPALEVEAGARDVEDQPSRAMPPDVADSPLPRPTA
ncbi:MAG TPA: HAMP domain-containing sensor histidine kinase [Dehalococcoidia bacterium]